MSDLKNYIEAENAKFKALAKADAPGCCVMTTVSDPAHWAAYGIYTVAEYQRYELEANLYDIYKEVNGFKPRHFNFKEMSMEELQAEYDSIWNSANAVYESEEAYIAKVCAEQNIDRATYDRWMKEADNGLSA